ncbi:MAG: PLDc N-terminal domain-containing protein [Candidatus Aenigmatarchaeota archaeon]
MIPLFIFWIWMLVDCIKRNFENKTQWIIILVFTSIIGAILYYFFVKRKNLQMQASLQLQQIRLPKWIFIPFLIVAAFIIVVFVIVLIRLFV